MDNDKILNMIIIVVLVALAFFLLKPILVAVSIGVILAFILYPIHSWSKKYINSSNTRALLISLLLALIILIPIIYLAPVIVGQIVKIYLASEQLDIASSITKAFPLLQTSEIPSILQSVFDSSLSKVVNSLASSLSIDNLVNYFLKSLVVLFTFFFVLRDKDSFTSYVKGLLPFSTSLQNRIFDRSKEITMSVLYGQFVVGILQGIATGIGFFIFGVPNALFLTLLAALAGIFPIIGTTIVWLPVAIYLLIGGNTFSAIGVALFGLVAASLDNFFRPFVVSKRSKMHPAIVLVGMIGGLFLFGFAGFILGPLVLAYLIIMVEVYRNTKNSMILTEASR